MLSLVLQDYFSGCIIKIVLGLLFVTYAAFGYLLCQRLFLKRNFRDLSGMTIGESIVLVL